MINLLPFPDRKAVRAEYRHRLFVIAGLLSFGLTLITSIILGSFAFILFSRRNEVLQQIAAARRQFAAEEFAAARKLIEETNESVKILRAAPSGESVASVYKRLIDERAPGIKLIRLGFSAEGGGRVDIDGRSPTRAVLLDFLDALGADSRFQSVDSPVKNIIRERDIDFHLTVVIDRVK